MFGQSGTPNELLEYYGLTEDEHYLKLLRIFVKNNKKDRTL